MRELLERRALGAVVLDRPGPVAWLTGGVTNRIEPGSPASPLWLVVTAAAVAGVTTNVERPRLEAESGLAALGIELHEAPWYDEDGLLRLAADLAGAPRARIGGLGVDLDDDLAELRLALVLPERERLSALGADAAWALEDALRAWTPGERDADVQARVAERLERAGAFGACLFVGGDERVERFRHPLAVGAPMFRLAMAVVVAERHGLHAAATRFACAGGLAEGVRHARVAALAVEEAILRACRPGAAYGDVLRALDRAYADAGHADAWAGHYQGGPVGYRQREFEIVPTQTESRWFATGIEAGHAVAWNPSVPGGGKAEDTYLVGADGLRRLTDTGSWPLDDERPGVLDVTTGDSAR
ncbi:MAG: M24 family metallopeptidase [Gaiellaceae bacterium]